MNSVGLHQHQIWSCLQNLFQRKSLKSSDANYCSYETHVKLPSSYTG